MKEGTMVVVENAKRYIGQTKKIEIIRSLQPATVELDTEGAHTVSVPVRNSEYYTATSTGSIQVN
ncbi:hypothetical protein EUA69_02945 [TM7 phylum sp. oral taxon 352]|nr:hypothetical protein EUA69_02945 [TM7 phylum sp. oral taxon 352]